MRLAARSIGIATWIAAAAVAGCAQGGVRGGDDAGPVVRFDAGTRDAGPRDDDASIPGLDAASDDAALPQDDAGTRDAGPFPPPDGGPPPPVDGGPTGCTSAAECSDGVYCNGAERCELGACVAGLPLSCDDSIACTRDRCLEPTSGTMPTCEYVRDDSLCGGGQVCGASGCDSSCSESPCRLLTPQCGCGAGQGCYLTGSTRACAAAGSATEGSSCTTPESCQPGLVCLNVSGGPTAVNQCGRFCASDAGCVGAGSLCIYTLSDGAGGSVPGVQVCSRACNPITSSGCSASAACHLFQESAGARRYHTDCIAPVGTGGQDAFCIDATDCRRGFACSGGYCLRYCNAPGTIAGGGCSFSEACYGFSPPLVIGSTEYGVCDWY